MVEYVCGFMFAEGRVALIKKSKPEWQKGRLNGIGGKIEDGETPKRAMVREFAEETGVSTFESEWLPQVILQGAGWTVRFFATWVAEKMVQLNNPDDEPCEWFSNGNLPPNVLPNLRWLIPLCEDHDITKPIVLLDHSDPTTNGATVTQKS